MVGEAVVFLRPDGGNGFGHVGWGYNLPGAGWMVGAVENSLGGLWEPTGQTGFWSRMVPDPDPVMANPGEFGAPQGTPPYAQARLVDVGAPNPAAAQAAVQQWSSRPFEAIGGNCLNCVYDVLTAFGAVLPAPSAFPEPNVWFAQVQGQPVQP